MPTGLTAKVGYQAGVRRSFSVGADTAWSGWGDVHGLTRWVGAVPQGLEKGSVVTLPDGTRMKVVSKEPPKLLRLRLEREEWSRARTFQLRLIPSVHGITVALHADGLPDVAEREALLKRWTHALEHWGAFSGRDIAESRKGAPKRDPAGKAGARKPPSLEEGLVKKATEELKKAGGMRGPKPVGGAKKKPVAAKKAPRGARKAVSKVRARRAK
jgi:hypothetical protein